MNILVTNDDGYNAPGIIALAAVALEFGNVAVVAPAQNQSGASSSLTLGGDISARQQSKQDGRDGQGARVARVVIVDGTPADCVHLLLSGARGGARLPDFAPDLVLSGINAGANLGDDTVYSGTVAAAIEGYLFGVSSVAFSLVDRNKIDGDYEVAQVVARDIVRRFCRADQPAAPTLLNVNIPNIAADKLRGIRATRLGRRRAAEPCEWQRAENGRDFYRIGEAGEPDDAADDTDFAAVAAGFASATPLGVDLTKHRQIGTIAAWLRA